MTPAATHEQTRQHDARNVDGEEVDYFRPPPPPAAVNWKQLVGAAILGGAVSAFITGAAGYITFNGRLQAVEERTAASAVTQTKLEEVRISVARIEVQIVAIKDAMDERYRGGH